MPLPLVNNGPTTIDLTGPDEVNILNVEKSPIKIIQRVSPSSPQLVIIIDKITIIIYTFQ